jgi:hypothetical protein
MIRFHFRQLYTSIYIVDEETGGHDAFISVLCEERKKKSFDVGYVLLHCRPRKE